MAISEASPSAVDPKPTARGVSTATNLGRLAGAVGIVLLVSTPFTFALTGMSSMVWGKLVLAVLLLGVYIATNADVFSRLAGARSTGLLVMTIVSVVVAFGLVGVVNYVAIKNPQEWDLTREGIYTLSDQTTGVLSRLEDDVKIFAFFSSAEPEYPVVQEILKRYGEAGGGKLTFEMVNPQEAPGLVEQYNITERGPRIVIAARKVVAEDGSESWLQDARARDMSEEELTNGIIKVAEQTSKTVFFLTGHGEGKIDDGENPEGFKVLADAIRSEGYVVEPLSLLQAATAKPGEKVQLEGAAEQAALEVPAKVAVLVIVGARSKLLDPEIAALERYVERGGRLVVLLEPDSDAGLSSFLSQWKIEPQRDLVVDANPLNRLMNLGPAAPLVQPPEEQMSHAAVKDLPEQVVLYASRSLKIASGGKPGVDAIPLLVTGPSAWGETALKDGSAAQDDKDNLGPVPVLVVASRAVTEPANKLADEGRVVVAGDSEWANNKYVSQFGNGDMILNLIHWMAEEQERMAIRPKTRQASQLYLTGEEMNQLKFLSFDILPVLIVAMGLGIVLIRRQR